MIKKKIPFFILAGIVLTAALFQPTTVLARSEASGLVTSSKRWALADQALGSLKALFQVTQPQDHPIYLPIIMKDLGLDPASNPTEVVTLTRSWRKTATVRPSSTATAAPAAFQNGYGSTAAFQNGYGSTAAFQNGYGSAAAFLNANRCAAAFQNCYSHGSSFFNANRCADADTSAWCPYLLRLASRQRC